MFVKIDNQDMDALKVEEWINRTRDANGGVISPEFAMEILGKTNHFAHIKKVINLIKKNCSDKNGELVADKVAPYKDFILSCVDRREMSPQAMAVLQELAETGGFRDEFDKVKDEPKCYFKNDCYKVAVVVKSREEFKALEGENLRVFFDADEIDLTWCDLDKVKRIRFRDGAVVDLSHAKKLSKDLDLDLSMCSKVDMFMCDLEGLNLKFREGAEVDLCWVRNLPKELDLSMCSEVSLSGCDLEGINFKFREGGGVNLSKTGKFPKDLDLSMCSKVDLSEGNLERVEKIMFREGAVVDLHMATELPEELDLSMCSVVNLGGCDLSRVHRIKFKDKAQEREFMEDARYFRGKVEYVGDEKGKNMVNGNSGMEM